MGRPLDGGEASADDVLAIVVELLLGEALAGESELEDGNAGGVVLDDEGRGGSWGQGCATAPG